MQRHPPKLSIYSGLCYLKVFRVSRGLENTSSRMYVSEETVVLQQAEEDLLIYGSRPEPSDAVEVDEADELASLPPKRSASEFKAAIDRAAKVRKKTDSRGFNYETLTAIDWNSGSSPLDAWLSQSAVPSTVENLRENLQDSSDERDTAQEREEIKVFRNIHIAIDSEKPELNPTLLDKVSDLDLEAQMYYRKIVDNDNYLELPTFLARRLAVANHCRAERLRHMKSRTTIPLTHTSVKNPALATDNKCASSSSPRGNVSPSENSMHIDGKDAVSGFPRNAGGGTSVASLRSPCESAEHLFNESPDSVQGQYFSIMDLQNIDPNFKGLKFKERQKASGAAIVREAQNPRDATISSEHVPYSSSSGSGADHADISGNTVRFAGNDRHHSPHYSYSSSPERGFWRGGTHSHRSGSVLSYVSSVNSPLHGSSIFDPEEQDPHFQTQDRSSSTRSGSFSREARGLPLPPVGLSEKVAFDCDICGQTIQVNRRLDWQ